MAGTFPTLSFGQVAMAPVSRSLTRATRVLQFDNDAEQRFPIAPAVAAFDLSFRGLKLVDLTALETFFETQKGAYDSTWTFPFLGVSYTSMCFDQDDFSATEPTPGKWSVNLRTRQTKKSITLPTVAAVFPTINGGVRTQLPFTRSLQYRTSRNDMDSGLRYSYFHRDFPLRVWTHSYPVITWTEGGTLLDFFTSMGGRYQTFTYTDPHDGTVYTQCRFGSDTFAMQVVGPNQVSVTLTIEQFG